MSTCWAALQLHQHDCLNKHSRWYTVDTLYPSWHLTWRITPTWANEGLGVSQWFGRFFVDNKDSNNYTVSVTFSPAYDVIRNAGHPLPEGSASWVVCIWRWYRLCLILSEPPELFTTEQVCVTIMGPNKCCFDLLNHPPIASSHAPFGQMAWVSRQYPGVLENPVLWTWKANEHNYRICLFPYKANRNIMHPKIHLHYITLHHKCINIQVETGDVYK